MERIEGHAGQRTGILTTHYGFNEGAILQAYALSELLRSEWGGGIEIVDQRYPSKTAAYIAAYGDPDANARTRAYARIRASAQKMAAYILAYGDPNANARIRGNAPIRAYARIRALANAIDGWLPLSTDRYRSTDSTPLIRELGDRYDRLVFGSDVIWRLHYRLHSGNLKQDHPFFPAFPNVYWPSAEQLCTKIVFSASIGPFDWGIVPEEHVRMMREGLESCYAISVRDEWTKEFVSQLSRSLADRVRLLADPTFSRAFREGVGLHQKDLALKESLSEMGVDFSRPRCLVIAEENGGAACAAVDYLERHGWQTVAVTERNRRCSLRLYNQGFHPVVWARLFGWFDACVTERMHGAIFSLLNNTPFLAIEVNTVPGIGSTKMQSLLRRFDLEDVLLQRDERDPATVQQTFERVLDTPWDWHRINEHIEEASDQQIEFLKGSRASAGGGSAQSLT